MKHAKKAFLASLLATLLCVTMLIGTTFAWFTDSVTSGGNKIISGTLDVDLFQWTDASTSVEITDASAPIFGSSTSAVAQNVNSDTLWEPGKTQVAYLSLKNNGNLWLKYTVKLTVKNVAKDLYEVMRYEIVPDAQYGTVTAWDAANGIAVGTSIAAGMTAVVDTAAVGVPMAPDAEHFFALAIHMQEEVGNQYQDGEVDFDIQVLATQYAQEEDSFGPDYDANADASPDNTYFFDTESTSAAVGTGDTVLTTNSATVTVPATAKTEGGTALAAGDTLTLTIEPTDNAGNISVAETNGTSSYEISLTNQNGEKIEASAGMKVELNIGFVDLQYFYHNGTALTEVNDLADVDEVNEYYYDPAMGIVTFITDTFSPFTAEYKYSGGLGSEEYPYIIASAKDFRAMTADYEYDDDWEQALNFYDYRLTSDITVENFCMNVVYVEVGPEAHDSYSSVFFGTFDGGNHTITFKWNDDTAMNTSAVALFGELAMATVKDLTVDCDINTAKDVGVLSSYMYYGATLENVTVSGTVRSSAGMGNIGGITIGLWETANGYYGLFKNVTVSADIYWTMREVTGSGYLYIAPFASQAVGLTNESFVNCVSSGSINVPYDAAVVGNLKDIYTGAFYALNPSWPDVPTANCSGNTSTCVNNIADFYELHVFTGLPENALN